MKSRFIAVLATFTLCLFVVAGCKSKPKTADEAEAMREEVRKMATETLATLEKTQPGSKKAVESAYGYAVFSNFGMKIFVAGSGSGQGVAVSRTPRAETFMRMVEVQAGLGIGVKKFRLVWVFTTEQTFNQFTNQGWEIGGQATATAQKGEQGGGMAGALAVAPGIYLYQITDTGLALELTAKGTKYFKDEKLN